MYRLLTIISFLIISSCAGVDSDVSMGENRYFVASSGTMGWSSGGEQKAKSIQNAEEFCMNKGKKLEVIKSSDSGNGAYGKISTGQVEFKCVDSD